MPPDCIPTDSSDCLVLGLAAGYHQGDVRPFLLSLHQGGFGGRCVLFASPTTRGVEQMRDWGAEVVAFEREGDRAHLPYNAYRYFLYLDFLRREPPCTRILLTDVRDVVFQGDPFAYAWSEAVNATLEDRRMTVGACPHNARWIAEHLGPAALAEVADRPISCSGTVLAGHRAMLDYLQRLTALLTPFDPGREAMAGYDQGVHNHLLHTGRLAGARVTDNAGPILTLGYRRGEPDVDGQGRVLNDAGAVPLLVHQYDRKPALHGMLRRRYA
ncbi:hypothetical protein [Desulfocurvus sp. DL9XJH121]